jgi:hypothetical protein
MRDPKVFLGEIVSWSGSGNAEVGGRAGIGLVQRLRMKSVLKSPDKAEAAVCAAACKA